MVNDDLNALRKVINEQLEEADLLIGRIAIADSANVPDDTVHLLDAISNDFDRALSKLRLINYSIRSSASPNGIMPLHYPGWLPHEGTCQTKEEVYETAPYKAGDVVYYKDDIGVAYEALIVEVCAEYMSWYGEWIQKYRVRIRNEDGTFAEDLRDTYPGWIERAYE